MHGLASHLRCFKPHNSVSGIGSGSTAAVTRIINDVVNDDEGKSANES